jgi:Rab-GTPase-TBC domain
MLFKANMPTLHTHFRRLQISSEQYLLDWLMSVYSRALPLRTCFRVWDCLLIEGDHFLYRVALALLFVNQKELLASGFEGCIETLRSVKVRIRWDRACVCVSLWSSMRQRTGGGEMGIACMLTSVCVRVCVCVFLFRRSKSRSSFRPSS